jgi:hypothetical protein
VKCGGGVRKKKRINTPKRKPTDDKKERKFVYYEQLKNEILDHTQKRKFLLDFFFLFYYLDT